MILRFYKFVMIVFVLFILSCTGKKHQPFSFAQLCDPQLGMGGYAHDVLAFKQAVKQVNKLQPDFVVICGDLVNHANDSSFAEFLNIIEGFEMPCHSVAGNHDVGKIPNDTTLNYYRETIGKDYYDFHNKGYAFIVTNSQLWKADIGKESENHDIWFKNTLKNQSTEGYPVFVIGHYPLYIGQPDEEELYFNLPQSKRQELLSLFQQYKVKAYLSGHKHELVVNNYKNIQLVTAETTSKNFDNRSLGFRLWNVSADTIKHQFVALQSLIDN